MCPRRKHHPSHMLWQKTVANHSFHSLSTCHGQNCMALRHLLTCRNSIPLFLFGPEHDVKQAYTQKEIFKSFSDQSSVPVRHNLIVTQA